MIKVPVRMERERESLASLGDKTGSVGYSQNLKSSKCHGKELFSQWGAIEGFQEK